MPSPRGNRKDPSDILADTYRVPLTEQARMGYPSRIYGTTSGSGVPAYTKYVLLAEYNDVTSRARCPGVFDDQIPLATGTIADALDNIEWRHIDRTVTICQFGVRDMVNRESGYVAVEGDQLAPFPGGFVHWQTGMAFLGSVNVGPIRFNKRGKVLVDVRFRTNGGAWPGGVVP